jgi:hypothetical protein
VGADEEHHTNPLIVEDGVDRPVGTTALEIELK